MRSRRSVAYLGCTTVVAACVGSGYDALHPSPASPDPVITWRSPRAVSTPLLPEAGHKLTMVAQWSPVWPPDQSRAAVLFFSEMINLLVAPTENGDHSVATGTEALPQPKLDRAPPSQPRRLVGWPFSDATETLRADRAQQWSEHHHPGKKPSRCCSAPWNQRVDARRRTVNARDYPGL